MLPKLEFVTPVRVKSGLNGLITVIVLFLVIMAQSPARVYAKEI